MKLKKEEFKWDNIVYKLRDPINYTETFNDGLWVIECAEFELHSFSFDRDGARVFFEEEFSHLYEELVNDDDKNLSTEALNLKHLLLTNVSKIVQ